MRNHLQVTLFSLTSLAACVPAPSGGSDSGAAAQRASDVAALRATANAYHAAASAKDAQAVVTFYDTEALMVPPDGELVEGIDGVRGYRFGFIATPGVELDFRLQRAEVSGAGDLGWTLAIGDITINREEGPPGKDLVRDFHTWKKQPDGSWKIVVDMWNSGLPPG